MQIKTISDFFRLFILARSAGRNPSAGTHQPIESPAYVIIDAHITEDALDFPAH